VAALKEFLKTTIIATDVLSGIRSCRAGHAMRLAQNRNAHREKFATTQSPAWPSSRSSLRCAADPFVLAGLVARTGLGVAYRTGSRTRCRQPAAVPVIKTMATADAGEGASDIKPR